MSKGKSLTAPNEDRHRVLLVGYGNPSRSDDGVGWYVAQQISERLGDQLHIRTYHQIEIDLAEDILDYDLVILVDAHVSDSPEGLIRHEVEPDYRLSPSSHHFTPATLLSISKALYDRPLPRLLLYTIKAHDLNFGEVLSPDTHRHADEAIESICELVRAEQ